MGEGYTCSDWIVGEMALARENPFHFWGGRGHKIDEDVRASTRFENLRGFCAAFIEKVAPRIMGAQPIRANSREVDLKCLIFFSI